MTSKEMFNKEIFKCDMKIREIKLSDIDKKFLELDKNAKVLKS